MTQQTQKKEPKTLRPDVAKVYELAHIAEAGEINTKTGLIDLSNIDLATAKCLAEDESFRYLVKKKSAGNKPAVSNTSTSK